MLRKAMAGFDSLASADSTDVADRAYYGMSNKIYGQCMTFLPGGADSAEAAYRRSMRAFEWVCARRPNNMEMQTQLADAHYLLSKLTWLVRGEPDTAIVHSRTAAEILEGVAKADSTNRSHTVQTLMANASLATILADAGHEREAKTLLDSSQPKIEQLAAKDTSQSILLEMLPNLYFARGLLETGGNPANAKATSRDAYARARPSFARAESTFAHALAHEGNWDLAHEVGARITQALAACDSVAGAGPLAKVPAPTR